MKAQTLKMKIKGKTYPILIGPGSTSELPKFLPKNVSRVFILSDERLVVPRKNLLRFLKAHQVEAFDIPLKAGEDLKSIAAVYPLYGKLLEKKADRNSVIVALGGGSIGDAAGFVAATFMRGITWIGVPTTLLAQVDSSIGGKTGINHEAGKNLIGTFHQPSLVICDTDYLETLSSREMTSGIGEMVKYSFTYDPKFFIYLEKNLDKVLSLDKKVLSETIKKALQWKCRAVEQDEFDRTGVREVLNFGHTFGHALESLTKYEKYQHGEAVIWGMKFALSLSEIRGKLKADERLKMVSLLRRLDIPKLPNRFDPGEVFSLMKTDKKSFGGSIRFVLLDKIGHAVLDHKVSLNDLHRAYELMVTR